MDNDDDLFDDLYDGDANDHDGPAPAVSTSAPAPAAKPAAEAVVAPAPIAEPPPVTISHDDLAPKPFDPSAEVARTFDEPSHEEKRYRPVQLKEDGKMFIGGLNWETTDQSLKDYFSQFGEVIECTVMRDGATGRSRGFGFLRFSDPKNVNAVMAKEHILDGKLIDPKRAIPRDEQEKTSKIFVGGVSQEATERDFKMYFEQFGRVLDATLMMDKDTGRPRGFGFVTFDDDSAVDNVLASDLIILGKRIEVKRAQPRNNVRDEDDGGSGRGGRFGGRGGRGGYSNFGDSHSQQGGQAGNNMSPAQMAQMWMNMQGMYRMMQQQNAMQQNPAMMQQMMMMQQAQQNPAMMQQMMQMYNQQQGGSPMNGAQGDQSPSHSQDPDQQNLDRQQARMQGANYNGGNVWEGMYDDVPAPNHRGRGGYRGGRGGPAAAPAGAPTGPKNAGRPGSNYRGGGRGGRGNWQPYPGRGAN